jgi:hypothetical protein
MFGQLCISSLSPRRRATRSLLSSSTGIAYVKSTSMYVKLATGKYGSDVGALSGADRSAAQSVRKIRASPSRFVFGWIYPTSAVPSVGSHSISGFTETTFVGHSPRHRVTIRLSRIPYSGHISPDAMVTCLSASISLETLGQHALSSPL